MGVIPIEPQDRPGEAGSAGCGRRWTAAERGLPDTFPKLLQRNAEIFAERAAIREKDLGIWQTWTWRQVGQEVQRIAAGLAAIGVSRGAKVLLVGDNRPQLYWAMCAAQALGAVPVPAYQDASAEEIGAVALRVEADVAVAEDQEQVDKLLAAREARGRPATIVYKDSRGLRHYTQPGLMALEDLQARGDALLAERPDAVEREIALGRGGDISALLHTSGTSGPPRAAMLTYDNVILSAANACAFDGLTEREEVMAYLPMAWVGDYVFSYAQSHVAGFCISCPESGATVLTDLREIGPTLFCSPPRIFETILTSISVRMEGAGRLKRGMYRFFMEVARRSGVAIQAGRPVGLRDRLLYRLGEALVYGPVKDVLGLSRLRRAYTACEAIGPDTFDMFRSLGVNLKQLYGMTEASVFICMQRDGEAEAETVGVPAPQVELRLAADGQVEVRGPGVFAGYHDDPAATAAALTEDGWLRTGDAGWLAADGRVGIVDRASDVGRLRDGTVLAPRYLENKLKFFPYIKEAVVFGDGRDHVVALVNIDLEAVGVWAERQRLIYAGFQDLAQMPKVRDLIAGCVERVNADLAADERRAGLRIRDFHILRRELDVDRGELTRTRKLRRQAVAEHQAATIEALYSAAARP